MLFDQCENKTPKAGYRGRSFLHVSALLILRGGFCRGKLTHTCSRSFLVFLRLRFDFGLLRVASLHPTFQHLPPSSHLPPLPTLAFTSLSPSPQRHLTFTLPHFPLFSPSLQHLFLTLPHHLQLLSFLITFSSRVCSFSSLIVDLLPSCFIVFARELAYVRPNI